MENVLIILIGLAAAAAVAWPLVRSTSASDPHLDPDPSVVEATDAQSAGAVGSPDIEREIMRYREARRAGTMCRRCTTANRAGSRFCAQCGKPLAGASAPTHT